MNNKSLDLSICEMRLHLFDQVELKVNEGEIDDAHAIACEWMVPGDDGINRNPDDDKSYVWLYEMRQKKVTDRKYRNFTDLDF